MNLHFAEASSLAVIDRQAENSDIQYSASQYEIIRQVIYHTADFEYSTLLKFSDGALAKGATALTASVPIITDVPEIQVKIVPQLQQTFYNPVYCCATSKSEPNQQTKAARGLNNLVKEHPKAIFIIGQDEMALSNLVDGIKSGTVNPSLAIATAPMFIEPEKKKILANSSIPYIYVDSPKGGASVASAILNSLLRLTWVAFQHHQTIK